MTGGQHLRASARTAVVPIGVGRYESFFIKAAKPGGGAAVWIRYTVHQPPGQPPTASLWLTVFGVGASGPRTAKVTYPAAELSFPKAAYLRIGNSMLEPGRAQGQIAGKQPGAGWHLTFPEGDPAFAHLPYRWLYDARFPRTKVETINPATRFLGQVWIGDQLIDVTDWPGTIGHNWGAEHAERWVWIQASDVDGRDGHLDIAAGRLMIAGRMSPWLANGQLTLDGEPIRLGGLDRISSTSVYESPTGCLFSVTGKEVVVSGRVSSRRREVVGWVYEDPAGGEHQVLNCSVSDLELSVQRRGTVKYVTAAGSAVYEIGTRETDPGIVMQRGVEAPAVPPAIGRDDTSAVPSSTMGLITADGERLLVRHWSAVGETWATVLIVHGVGEHSGRYERTGERLARAGITVTALDLRGHGGSGGFRGDVAHWTDFLDDLSLVMSTVSNASGRRPVVLLGHSMGGLICTDYVLSGRSAPDALVLSAPAFVDNLPRWQHRLGPIIARIKPDLAFSNAWGPEALSRDPEVGRSAIEDPRCPQRATVRLGASAFDAQHRVRANLSDLLLPTLVFHGSADPLIPVRGSHMMDGRPATTVHIYQGLRHECLNEPEGPRVCSDIVNWIRTSVPNTPRPPGPA